MSIPLSNRDLYLEIAKMLPEHRQDSRPLSHYLRALLGLFQAYRDKPSLTPSEFLQVLGQAFKAEAAPVDGSWFELSPQDARQVGYEGFSSILKAQIVDLIEMEQEGMLKDEQRYFGIDAPRGARWYNFDPCTYLECGMTGSLGGWEEGDDTGREYVPGKVAVLGADGKWTSVNPEEIESPVVVMEELDWETLKQFLYCGQQYE